jgi:mRNA-degrading endonuclease RelE of RelBE toxin-antitoxin system
MENEVYIANRLADTLKRMPSDQQAHVASLIDSLGGDGWKNSHVVAADNSQGGGLRARISGNLRLLFRYAPEQHAIIVTDVESMQERELAVAS